MLELFQYLSDVDPSPPLTGSDEAHVFGQDKSQSRSSQHRPGKPIAATPLGRVYLEPRSLFIMRKGLYQNYLHGIQPVGQDILKLSSSLSTGKGCSATKRIANEEYLDPDLLDKMRAESGDDGLTVARSTRVSLTFRQVTRKLHL